jgi:hypothetical protein
MVEEQAKQEITIKQVASTAVLLYAGFLLGLFFGPEDGGEIFLRNVG